MAYKNKEKQREYARLWIAKRRQEFFTDKRCIQCGSTDRMELDHIDPTTKISHNIWSWSKERQLNEIAKCQILCYYCHKEKTRFQVVKWSESVFCSKGHRKTTHTVRKDRNTVRCRICDRDYMQQYRNNLGDSVGCIMDPPKVTC